MSKAQTKVKDKYLLVVLIALCAMGVTLLVIVIINAIPKSPEEIALEQQISELYFDGMTEEDYKSAKEEEDYYRLTFEVQELLKKDPVDVDKINKLYDDAIEKMISGSRPYDAFDLVVSRGGVLASRGLKREALDAMLKTDFNIYSDLNKYRLYTMVIDLAKELNDDSVVSEYRALRETVSNVYRENLIRTFEYEISSEEDTDWSSDELDEDIEMEE